MLVIMLLLLSCGGLEDDDPAENPVEVIGTLLEQAQPALAMTAGGEYALYPSVFMQQVAGIDGALTDIDRYDIRPEHTDKSWNAFYLNVLSSINTIIEYSASAGYYKARGMARIMMAHSLGLVTSAWGDVPFSESFFTDDVSLRPSYDTQEELYNRIFSLLEDGIDDMMSYGNQEFPSGQDMFFAGDHDKWIRLAGFLKLRFSLHLSGRTGYAGLTQLIENRMFRQGSDKLEVNFSAFEDFSHPLYQYLLIHPGSAGAGLYFVNDMKAAGDPRLDVYFKASDSGIIEGSAAGVANQDAGLISAEFISSGSPVVLASFTEQKFIEAEIYLENNMLPAAIEAFNEGMRSSLVENEVFIEEWFDQYKAVDGLTIEKIIRSKYTALFLQAEIWNDWRRTGYPRLEPATGNTTNDLIPRRLPYPESEYMYNQENVPPDVEITTPVWWDSE